MSAKKKSFRLEKAISVLCLILCLLSILSYGGELSAKTGSASVVVNPSESIQTAINNATTGDTIFVRVGTYNESLTVDKSISLIGEDRDQTIIDGQNNQFIINITANNVNIEGFTIRSVLNPSSGISIINSKGNVIRHNIIENSSQGIFLFQSSSNNIISDNIIRENIRGGIAVFYFSNNNLFSGNMISDNKGGFSIYLSTGNVFSGNTLAGNYPSGEIVSSSNNNVFYDNNFYDPFLVDINFANTWDNGREGNYWSNYAGHDSGDGIGIEYYDVAAGNITLNADRLNIDQHPLMGEFSSFDANLAGETYQVSIISNSTVSDFKFEVGTETGNKIIQFNVTGAESTVGFSRIAIPKGLMNTSVSVLVGEKEIIPTSLSSQNTALNYLYFTYSHSNQTVLIIYSETLNLYNQLLDKFLMLNDTYYGLLSNFNTQLQTGLRNLNSSYNGLLNNYADLNASYNQLQQSYADLNASYQQHLLDYSQNLQNVRSLMYIFAAATAILIVITVYLSKHTHSRPTKAPEEKDRY